MYSNWQRTLWNTSRQGKVVLFVVQVAAYCLAATYFFFIISNNYYYDKKEKNEETNYFCINDDGCSGTDGLLKRQL
jgi:hypothetical protein